MTVASFNGSEEDIGSIESLGLALDRYASHAEFELWLSMPEGPSLCMLRSGKHSFLMYLRFPGDSGYVSSRGVDAEGQVQYKLSNGQIDEYPRSWCVPVEQCFKALAYFFVNDGQRPAWLAWHES